MYNYQISKIKIMETNIDQNKDNNQPKTKNTGFLGGLGILTGFILILIIIFYGINWIIG